MPWGFLLLHSIGQVFVKAVEALLPERAVLLDPVGGGVQGSGIEPAVVDAPLAPPLEQPGVFENFQVPGDRG
jgi:hypothetical protein